MRCRLGLCAVLIAVLLPLSASASPWTLPKDELTLSFDFNLGMARREFLQNGDREVYPFEGRFQTSGLYMGARYGFTDNFELSADVALKQIAFTSDVVVANLKDTYTLEEARESVLDFSGMDWGAGDMRLTGRYNFLRSALMVTGEVSAKIPLGYRAPEGTFEPDTLAQRLADGLPPEKLGDDLALGDGQIDVAATLLLGTYIAPTSTFVRAGLGYNHRFDSPGDQLLVDAKIGQYLTQRLIPFVGIRWNKTLFEGEVIGNTPFYPNPEAPASEFNINAVQIQDLRLDRDVLQWEAGLIMRFDALDLQLAYTHVVDGKNTAALRAVDIALVFSIPNATTCGMAVCEEGEQEAVAEPTAEEPAVAEPVGPANSQIVEP